MTLTVMALMAVVSAGMASVAMRKPQEARVAVRARR